MTLDLNGKTITDESWAGQSPVKQALFYVKSGTKFTINDSSNGKTGKITTTNSGIYSAVTLTINGQNDESKTAEVVVNGGTLQGYYYGVCTNGNRHNTAITINGGKLVGYNSAEGVGLYNANKGSLTITGGEFEGYDGLAIKGGTVNISGGTFTGKGAFVDPETPQGSGTNNVGAALYVEDNYDYEIVVNISGGTFNATGTKGKSVFKKFISEPAAQINITGGTFTPATEYYTE